MQAPGGLVASVFSNGYAAPLVVEVRADSLDELDAKSKAVAAVARTVAGVRDIYPSLQTDYPELRVETDRTEASLVDVSARSAAQTTLDATNPKRQHRTDAGVVVEELSRLRSRSDYFRSGSHSEI